jgi:uncharacterized protein (TIGR00369 family)
VNDPDRALRALDTPLLAFLGARPLDRSRPEAGLAINVSDEILNAVGALHGGVMSTLLDVAAYMALTPELRDDEEAITHALFASYQRTASDGEEVVALGHVTRRTRRLAFVTSELRNQNEMLASAQVTKSIVSSGKTASHRRKAQRSPLSE